MPRQNAFPVPERGSGARFVRHTGIAAPYMVDNMSTDVPSPPADASGLGALGMTSEAEMAFANIRYFADGTERPDFVFNQEPYRTASIMIVGLNYGTGSSRSGAITRPLAAWGVRVYLGQSFGPIFLTNAVQYGVLTVELPRPTLDMLAEWARTNPGVEMTVDLEREVIEVPGLAPITFEANDRYRRKLMEGVTDLEEMEPHLPAAAAQRTEDEQARPWVYQYR